MFFGNVRQATGPNDHPTTPTFLQVYNMLSCYSILKPPKTGNCTILETTDKPKITVADLKEIFGSNEPVRKNKIEGLKNQLDKLIKEDSWEVEDIFVDHNYCVTSTRDAITYYICGYLCRQIKKWTSCNICLTAMRKGKI